MRHAACVVLVAVLAAAAGLAPAAEIAGPRAVEPYRLVRLTAADVGPKTGVLWRVRGPGQVDYATPRKGRELVFVAPPGKYTVSLLTVKTTAAGPELDEVETEVVIGIPDPMPPTPTPPAPVPPAPQPPLPPAPEGFRVIFVYETSAPLTPAAQQVMFSEKVRQYLDAKAKGWRRFDKDVDAGNEKDAEIKALWQAARPKVTAVPAVIVAVGGKAEVLPLPADEDAALKTLKQYGGE
jgi:hypothetical protein